MDTIPHRQLVNCQCVTSCAPDPCCILCLPGTARLVNGRLHSVSSNYSWWYYLILRLTQQVMLFCTWHIFTNQMSCPSDWAGSGLRSGLFSWYRIGSIIWSDGSSTTQILGSLLAAGLLQMRGIHGWGGWRWLWVPLILMKVRILIVTGSWLRVSSLVVSESLRGSLCPPAHARQRVSCVERTVGLQNTRRRSSWTGYYATIHQRVIWISKHSDSNSHS